MFWNYRVVRKGNYYGVHEAYYDEQGAPHSLSEDSVTPVAEGLEALRERLAQVFAAFDDPVLDYDDVGAKKAT